MYRWSRLHQNIPCPSGHATTTTSSFPALGQIKPHTSSPPGQPSKAGSEGTTYYIYKESEKCTYIFVVNKYLLGPSSSVSQGKAVFSS